MEEDFIDLGYVEFFEDDFDLSPDEFKELLQKMHDAFDLENVDPLLTFAENIEAYEICSVIVDFKKNVLKK